MIAIEMITSDGNVCLLANYLIRIGKRYFVAKPQLQYEQRENDVWYPLKDCLFEDPNGVKYNYHALFEIGQII